MRPLLSRIILTARPNRATFLWALLMGCITTIVIAWGLTLWRPADQLETSAGRGYMVDPSQRTLILTSVASEIGSFRRFARAETQETWHSDNQPFRAWSAFHTPPENTNQIMIEEARGYPFLALRTTWRATNTTSDQTNPLNPPLDAFESNSPLPIRPFVETSIHSFAFQNGLRALPTSIIPFGFAMNVVVFTLLWLILPHPFRLFFIIRHQRRYKRNLCVHCGYNLVQTRSERCSECGSVLSENQRWWKPMSQRVWSRLVIVACLLLVITVGFVAWQWRTPWSLPEATLLHDMTAVQNAIDRGDDIDEMLGLGYLHQYPVAIAASVHANDILSMLIERGADLRGDRGAGAIVLASQYDNHEAIDLLCNAGVDLNRGFVWKRMSVIAASIQFGASVRTVERLLDLGADARGPRGFWAISAAFYSDEMNRAIIELLVAHGAYVNTQDRSGSTLLTGCAGSGSDEQIMLLLELEADPTTPNSKGETPLMWAAAKCEPETLEALIAHGAQVNAEDSAGDTPLVYAARAAMKHENAVVLVRHGAMLNEQSKNILNYLRPRPSQEFCDLLLQAGAHPLRAEGGSDDVSLDEETVDERDR